jgi:hypothetical protein
VHSGLLFDFTAENFVVSKKASRFVFFKNALNFADFSLCLGDYCETASPTLPDTDKSVQVCVSAVLLTELITPE